ncbi:hypothetical protein P692DRAFT_20299602 [Suillus brevipes Sb2]|nr:hypothetical protein P692DRAFT_20299602 [Suillus brevipes Sb2]
MDRNGRQPCHFLRHYRKMKSIRYICPLSGSEEGGEITAAWQECMSDRIVCICSGNSNRPFTLRIVLTLLACLFCCRLVLMLCYSAVDPSFRGNSLDKRWLLWLGRSVDRGRHASIQKLGVFQISIDSLIHREVAVPA